MPLARVNTTHAQVRIAVVGEGTGDVLRGAPDAVQLDIAFTPTKARHVQDALSSLVMLYFMYAVAVSMPCSETSSMAMRLPNYHKCCRDAP